MSEGASGSAMDGSFSIGVRRTFPVALGVAWSRIFSEEGLALWLGRLSSGAIEPESAYRTEGGISGLVRVHKPLSHVRLGWKPDAWDKDTILQLRLIPSKGGTTVSFHQERLKDSVQRELMRARWTSALDALGPLLSERG